MSLLVLPLGWIVLGAAAIYRVFSLLLPERVLRQRLSRRPSVSFNEIYHAS